MVATLIPSRHLNLRAPRRAPRLNSILFIFLYAFSAVLLLFLNGPARAFLGVLHVAYEFSRGEWGLHPMCSPGKTSVVTVVSREHRVRLGGLVGLSGGFSPHSDQPTIRGESKT